MLQVPSLCGGYVYCYSHVFFLVIRMKRSEAPCNRWEPWYAPMYIEMFIVLSVLVWTMALHSDVKYDTICDNYEQSDAYGSWSYLMWVILQ